MKVYGYEKVDGCDSKLMELSEVTFSASPETLRYIATVINKIADDMESEGKSFEHAHIQDHCTKWDGMFPDIIISSNAT